MEIAGSAAHATALPKQQVFALRQQNHLASAGTMSSSGVRDK